MNKEDTFPGLMQVFAFSQTADIRRSVSQKLAEPSVETPCWCTSVVHQFCAGTSGFKHLELTLAIWVTDYLY